MVSNLMVFYKGALSWEALQSMPLDKLIDLNQDANRIIEEAERRAKSGV